MWSHDGNYLAKKFKQDIAKEDGTNKVKTGVSVYQLPTMELI